MMDFIILPDTDKGAEGAEGADTAVPPPPPAPSPARGKGLNPTNPVDVTSAWTTPNCSVPRGALTIPGTRRSVSAPLPSVRNRLNRRSSLSVVTSALDADARSTSLPRRASIKPRRSARACVSGSAVSSPT